MATTTNKPSGLTALMQAGKKSEDNLKKITSVVTETEDIVEQSPIAPDASVVVPPSVLPEKIHTGIEFFFTERKDDANEMLRYPRELHKKIKLLATVTGTPMGSIVSNILETTLKQYEKEINKIIKSGI